MRRRSALPVSLLASRRPITDMTVSRHRVSDTTDVLFSSPHSRFTIIKDSIKQKASLPIKIQKKATSDCKHHFLSNRALRDKIQSVRPPTMPLVWTLVDTKQSSSVHYYFCKGTLLENYPSC